MGGGGAPLRYEYTAGGFSSFQPWNETSCAYSILQLYKGYNPLSKLEVVSTLNTLNLGRAMYYYGYDINTKKYNPKVYLGTTQTIAYVWNFDRQIYAGSDIKYPSIWPEVKPQKGEAIIECYKKTLAN